MLLSLNVFLIYLLLLPNISYDSIDKNATIITSDALGSCSYKIFPNIKTQNDSDNTTKLSIDRSLALKLCVCLHL